MALNPPLSLSGIPLRVADEYILLERDGTEVEIKVQGMKSLSGKGKIFLTSARLVFVNQNFQTEYFKSFDLPLALMRHLDFKQPIFGSNYIEMTIMPLYNLIPAPGQVKIWFTKGGCDKFLRIFDVAKAQVATQLKSGRMAHDNDFNQKIRNGFFANSSAYQDPNDPTYVYVQQPNHTFSNTNQYLGNQDYYHQFQQPNNQGTHQPQQQPNVPQQHQTGGPIGNNQMNNNYPTTGSFQGNGVSIGSIDIIKGGHQHQNTGFNSNNANHQGGVNLHQPINTNYPQPPESHHESNPYSPEGNYPQGMNNPQAANFNQPGVAYYFGVPIGPQVQRNY